MPHSPGRASGSVTARTAAGGGEWGQKGSQESRAAGHSHPGAEASDSFLAHVWFAIAEFKHFFEVGIFITGHRKGEKGVSCPAAGGEEPPGLPGERERVPRLAGA